MLIMLPGIDPSRVNMGRLFLMPDKLKFMRNNRALQYRLQQHVKQRPYLQELQDPVRQMQNFAGYKRACTPFYRAITPIIPAMLKHQNCTEVHDSAPLPGPKPGVTV